MSTMSTESNRTDYSCARCEKTLPTKNHLREHLRVNHQIYEDNNVKTYSYECSECGKVSSNFDYFNNHWLRHEPPKLFCAECPAKFRRSEDFRKHLRKRHNKIAKRQLNKFECHQCRKAFKTSYRLNLHMAYHKEPQFSCTECGNKFFHWIGLKTHIRFTHKNSRFSKTVGDGMAKESSVKGKTSDFTCAICQRQFTYARTLSNHALLHKPKRFKCSMCEAQFYYQGGLDKHQSSIHSITVKKENKCDICGKEFRSPPGLIHHKRFHSSPTVSCSRCDMKFYTEGYLAIHTKSVHFTKWQIPNRRSTKQPTYICAICCRPYGQRYSLKQHLRSHYGYDKKTLDCHICQRIFNTSGSFQNHFDRVHKLEQKSFECYKCVKVLKSAYQLNSHLAHHKAPQFSCTNCGKTFFQSTDLHSHITQAHCKRWDNTGMSAELNCPICGKQFASASTLSSHSVLHKPKQFKCEMCEAEFYRQYELNRHQASKHFINVKKPISEVCGKEFPSHRGLHLHKVSHSSRTLTCSRCERKFYSKRLLLRHIEHIHTTKFPMPKRSAIVEHPTCAICCRPFGTKTLVTTHLHIHYRVGNSSNVIFANRFSLG